MNSDRLHHVQNVLAQVVAEAPWTVISMNIHHNLHWLLVSHHMTQTLPYCMEYISHCPNYPVSRVNYPLPTIHILLTQIFWLDHAASLITFPLGPCCFCTIYLELSTCTRLLYWQCQLKSHFWFFCLGTLCQRVRFISWFWSFTTVCSYVCMYVSVISQCAIKMAKHITK